MRDSSLLFLGVEHPDVRELVDRLRAEGFWTLSHTPGEITPDVEAAILEFQRTHLGPDGRFLQADGVVGAATRWALSHASGEGQRSHVDASIPAGLGPQRQRVLEVALQEHARGVAEVPSGSNRGPELDKYLPQWAKTQPGPAWCCFFYSWVVRSALDAWPLGAQLGSCRNARQRAGALGLYTPKGTRAERPIPGDAFLMDRGGGHGHIGFVLRVSDDRTTINTVEGNCGNRVKVGLRELSDPELVGFIDNVPSEATEGWELGVLSARRVGGARPDSTR